MKGTATYTCQRYSHPPLINVQSGCIDPSVAARTSFSGLTVFDVASPMTPSNVVAKGCRNARSQVHRRLLSGCESSHPSILRFSINKLVHREYRAVDPTFGGRWNRAELEWISVEYPRGVE